MNFFNLTPPRTSIVSAPAGSARLFLAFGLSLLLCLHAPAQQSADSQAPLTGIESIFALVPSSVNLRQGSGYNPVALKQAEDTIIKQATGKTAVLSFKVELVEPTKDYGFAYHLKSPITPLSVRGVNLNYEVWGLFSEDQAAAVAKVQKGSMVNVAGTLDHCNIIMREGKPLLRADLASARLYGSLSAAIASIPKTIDTIKVGDPASEEAHGQKGEATTTGMFHNRAFRQALGGWFSYQVRTLPNQPTDLVLTYWGDDDGNRRFDILANDRKIGSQVLEKNHPGSFFEERYTIPAGLGATPSGGSAQAASTVTIRLQGAVPGAMVGGLFGLRTEPSAR